MPDRQRMTNPELDQDRATDLCESWARHGYVMFPQQQAIYTSLARCVGWRSVLEAGCGDGVGSARLERRAKPGGFVATDKLPGNVAFARALYPWIAFEVWDISRPWHGRPAESVVAVECVEHVADPERALAHLIAAATGEVWFTTPNGLVKGEHPPSNPYHCDEFTPREVLAMLPASLPVEIYHWQTFAKLGVENDVNPLVYRVRV